jgi:flagellar motor switch protein FliG
MSTREPSIRKAAVLIASLDVDTADMLLGQMPPQQADEVRREVLELGELDPVEQKRVIDEFFRIGPLMPEQEPPGLQLDDAVLNRLARPIDEYVPTISSPALEREEPQVDRSYHDHSRQHKFEVAPSGDHSYSNEPPFSFLHDAEPEALVPLLEREHPQAIALVLAHLPAERAGHVLARLPAAMQTDVIRRLVDMEETDPHVVRDVERAVAAWLNRRQPARRRVAGMEAVSAILNASDGSARRQILNNLATHNRPLAHKLTPPAPPPRQFSFAEVCELPWSALERIIRSADRRCVVLALAGAAADVVQDILDQLRLDEARWLSHRLSHLGPLRLSDIDRAQDDLAELAGQLYADGRLPGLSDSHLTAVA